MQRTRFARNFLVVPPLSTFLFYLHAVLSILLFLFFASSSSSHFFFLQPRVLSLPLYLRGTFLLAVRTFLSRLVARFFFCQNACFSSLLCLCPSWQRNAFSFLLPPFPCSLYTRSPPVYTCSRSSSSVVPFLAPPSSSLGCKRSRSCTRETANTVHAGVGHVRAALFARLQSGFYRTRALAPFSVASSLRFYSFVSRGTIETPRSSNVDQLINERSDGA